MTGTNATKCLADRLQDLIANSGKDGKSLAAEIGISSGALSKYQNDGAEAGITAIYKIAKHFGVTADYLIGLSNNMKPENTDVGDRLGLSDKAIETLSELNTIVQNPPNTPFLNLDFPLSKIVNMLICGSGFSWLITRIGFAIMSGEKELKREANGIDFDKYNFDDPNFELLIPCEAKEYHLYLCQNTFGKIIDEICNEIVNEKFAAEGGAINADNPEAR